MFGRMMNEPWGKVHFFLTFIFSNCVFFPMHIIGVAGHPRRYYDPTIYRYLENVQPINEFMSVCAILLGLTQFIFVANLLYSLLWGPRAGRNPWKSNTLEWTAPSPPPHGNFEEPPIVRRGPYEYGVPGMEADYLPQTDPTPVGAQLAHAH
jgi:cytochrome c oxidase subunit 1